MIVLAPSYVDLRRKGWVKVTIQSLKIKIFLLPHFDHIMTVKVDFRVSCESVLLAKLTVGISGVCGTYPNRVGTPLSVFLGKEHVHELAVEILQHRVASWICEDRVKIASTQ